ncbi:MAG: aKG-HExxH-type peptide beta-hydroxylase, partial [Catenulispora sp.]
HEFQHVKLGAVLDAYDLYDESDRRHFYAPWRDDPRPFEGLLQGTYAHIAVTDFWRVRRLRLDGPPAEAAEQHFTRWRLHTAEAIDVLAGSGSLTPLGARFVEGMRATVLPWLSEPVAAAAEQAARNSSERHLAAYRRRTDRGADV